MTSLEDIVKDINKKYKSKMAHIGSVPDDSAKVPFISPMLNWSMRGGLPKGGIIEFFGREGSGKTTTALGYLAQVQEQERIAFESGESEFEKKVVIFDVENTILSSWCITLGLDITKVIFIRPENQTAEQVLDMVRTVAESKETSAILLDSIAFLVPQSVYDESLEKSNYAGVAKTLTRFSSLITPIIKKNQILFIGVNQPRDVIGSMFPMEDTPGGRAWKHACIMRIQFKKGKFIEQNGNIAEKSNIENPAGNIVDLSIKKNKVTIPDRPNSSYTLMYYTGIDYVRDFIDFGAIQGIVLKKGGGYMNFINPQTGEVLADEDGKVIQVQGTANATTFLKENPEFYQQLLSYISYNDTDGVE